MSKLVFKYTTKHLQKIDRVFMRRIIREHGQKPANKNAELFKQAQTLEGEPVALPSMHVGKIRKKQLLSLGDIPTDRENYAVKNSDEVWHAKKRLDTLKVEDLDRILEEYGIRATYCVRVAKVYLIAHIRSDVELDIQRVNTVRGKLADDWVSGHDGVCSEQNKHLNDLLLKVRPFSKQQKNPRAKKKNSDEEEDSNDSEQDDSEQDEDEKDLIIGKQEDDSEYVPRKRKRVSPQRFPEEERHVTFAAEEAAAAAAADKDIDKAVEPVAKKVAEKPKLKPALKPTAVPKQSPEANRPAVEKPKLRMSVPVSYTVELLQELTDPQTVEEKSVVFRSAFPDYKVEAKAFMVLERNIPASGRSADTISKQYSEMMGTSFRVLVKPRFA